MDPIGGTHSIVSEFGIPLSCLASRLAIVSAFVLKTCKALKCCCTPAINDESARPDKITTKQLKVKQQDRNTYHLIRKHWDYGTWQTLSTTRPHRQRSTPSSSASPPQHETGFESSLVELALARKGSTQTLCRCVKQERWHRLACPSALTRPSRPEEKLLTPPQKTPPSCNLST